MILRHFDAYAEYQNSGITMAEFRLEPLHEFMSLKRFRAEFVEALVAPQFARADYY
jgi:hypothetical protein